MQPVCKKADNDCSSAAMPSPAYGGKTVIVAYQAPTTSVHENEQFNSTVEQKNG